MPHLHHLRTILTSGLGLLGWLMMGFTGSDVRGNFISNSSFETGIWSGNQDFVDTGNATSLFSNTSTIDGWATNNGSTWVEDSTRTTDGNRMLWLGPPTVGSNVCVARTFSVFASGDSTTQFVGGSDYSIALNFAFFDPNDPTASNAALSTLQIYALLGSTTGIGDDPFTQSQFTGTSYILNTSGTVSPWTASGGGSGINWQTGSFAFTMPDVTGYDYVKFFISAPRNTGSVPSRGVLVDDIALTAAPTPVPEPSSTFILLAGLLSLSLRRVKPRVMDRR